MKIRNIAIYALMILLSMQVYGASDTDQMNRPDSIKRSNRISRLIYRTLSTKPRDRTAEAKRAQQEMDSLLPFIGKTIGQITIIRNPVFDSSTKLWTERKGNSIHRITQERQIRKDLFIKPGDPFDPLLLSKNRQLLRSRSYLSSVDIQAVQSTDDPSKVDLIITTKDRWSISVDLNATGSGNTFFELYDDNILGWGSKLSVTTAFNWKNWNYGGNQFLYEKQNILGTFISGHLIAGKKFDRQDYGGAFKKEFIKPTDYSLGGYMFYRKEPLYIYTMDSTVNSSSDKWGVWGGKSFFLNGLQNSIFITGHFSTIRYRERPEVSESLNPYFHHEKRLLFSGGLYRERFRTSNLIYGYGVDEDIAYGYLFSLCAGPSWGEFGNRWYMGGTFSAGHFTRIGYLRWGMTLGSYLNNFNGNFYRTALTSNLNWFSKLMGQGRYKVRQFIDLNYTRGWNRMDGYCEYVEFQNNGDLRGLRDHIYGNHRLVVNSETVIFTPWNAYQFRFALYGFVDMGLLGNEGNLFKNPFFTTVGLGVRIKNERLIFRTINIRLGFAVGRGGFMNADYFLLNTENKRQPIRYIPQKASLVDFENTLQNTNT